MITSKEIDRSNFVDYTFKILALISDHKCPTAGLKTLLDIYGIQISVISM